MEKFKVNGKEVEFDPFDLDAMEAYLAGTALRRVCNAILDFFDDLLGEGRAVELFGQRVNVKDIFEGYRDFTTQVNGCISSYSKGLGGAQPAAVVPLNRAQRRQK